MHAAGHAHALSSVLLEHSSYTMHRYRKKVEKDEDYIKTVVRLGK